MSFFAIKQRAQSLKAMYSSSSSAQANSRNNDIYQNRPVTLNDTSGQRSIVIEKEPKQTKTMQDLQKNLSINKDIIQSLIEAQQAKSKNDQISRL